MSIKALQDYVYVSKYARYSKENKRRETWAEAVERVKQMHLKKYPQAKEEIEWAFELVRRKRVLGSQRALQFGGKPIEEKQARIYNCSSSYCDRIRMFQETFWLLLCGCGTGFSVQKHHIDKLPPFFSHRINPKTTPPVRIFTIPDSIEGWANALGILLATYFPHPEFKDWEGYEVEFDYSRIRPAGSMLSSGAGKAPGHKPLKRSLEIIHTLLNKLVEKKQERLRPIDAYDIIMHASDAVLSGGVRRSATICLFSYDDEEMARSKMGNWFVENPQRARSNNSAILLRNKTSKEDFLKLINCVKDCGEPGFVWTDNTELCVNPCCEIGMYPTHWQTGETGWQVCNLTELNGNKIKTKEDFRLAARAGAIIGTLQAGYTNLDYLGQTTKEIIEREALLGVSITGMMDNPGVLFDAETQREMAQLILDTNEQLAKKIGINPAARTTCIKPAGTTSCILGSASGIHPHHAKRYFRRVQGNYLETPLQHFKKVNPLAVEKCVWSANKTDEVITFCVEVPDGSKTKNQLSACELLKYVKTTQQNWVQYGTRKEACTQPWLVHNVSNTITIQETEWEEVANFIYENREYFAGVSLIPASGDLDFPQAPMCAVLTPRETVNLYGEGSLFASGLIVDGLKAFDNDLWAACDAALGRGNPLTEPEIPVQTNEAIAFSIATAKEWVVNHKKWLEKIDWIRRAHQFSVRYFENDVRKMTYCLKTVNNWKLWCDLLREYKDVDYLEMKEMEDNTELVNTIACSGGACEII